MGAAQTPTDGASAVEADMSDAGGAHEARVGEESLLPKLDIIQLIAAATARTSEPNPVGKMAAAFEPNMVPLGVLPIHLRHIYNLQEEMKAEHAAIHQAQGAVASTLLTAVFDEASIEAKIKELGAAHEHYHFCEPLLDMLLRLSVQQTFPNMPEGATGLVTHDDWSVSAIVREASDLFGDGSGINLEAIFLESLLGGRNGGVQVKVHHMGGLRTRHGTFDDPLGLFGGSRHEDGPRGFLNALAAAFGRRRKQPDD